MIVLDNFVLLYKVIVLPLCFIVGLCVRKQIVCIIDLLYVFAPSCVVCVGVYDNGKGEFWIYFRKMFLSDVNK